MSKEELFDKTEVSSISDFVESKSPILNEIDDFKEKDKMLSLNMELFEKELSTEDKEKFDNIIKLMYQVEEYYISLAYSLGVKYGKNIDKM